MTTAAKPDLVSKGVASQSGDDPSMEDILASIRRILSEEEPPEGTTRAMIRPMIPRGRLPTRTCWCWTRR